MPNPYFVLLVEVLVVLLWILVTLATITFADIRLNLSLGNKVADVSAFIIFFFLWPIFWAVCIIYQVLKLVKKVASAFIWVGVSIGQLAAEKLPR